ncbi:TPA_asm: hypothetical protein GahPV1_gp16 [Geoglobus ahangari pleomorphic virus 1]|uniref:Uncharacterized protein n=1 Tax=Geoglobus ahangari pleomorphic virus 1 TaxID=3115752 RepID=A0AAT9JB21_9VIRU|nr:hypothetical protein [Geoglobus ahangari]
MLYVECYPDESLAISLGVRKRDVIHAHSKGNVCKKLERTKNSKGMVDEDPGSSQPSYIKSLRVEEEKHDLKLLLDPRNGNYLIVVCPNLEEWIIRTAREAGVDLRRMGLPNDPNRLHKVINSNLDKFEKLLSELQGRSKRLETLRGYLL